MNTKKLSSITNKNLKKQNTKPKLTSKSSNKNNNLKDDIFFNTIRAPKNKSFIGHRKDEQEKSIVKSPFNPSSPKPEKNNLTLKPKILISNTSRKDIHLNTTDIKKEMRKQIFNDIIKEEKTIENENKTVPNTFLNNILNTNNTQNNTLINNTQPNPIIYSNLIKTLVSCPKCHKIPLCSLVEGEVTKIKIHCPCTYKGTIEIKDFINNNNKAKPDKSKCNKHSKKMQEFCINCQKWFCEECIKVHEKYSTHILIRNQINIELHCKEHRNKNFEYFCTRCHLELCQDCYPIHAEHKTIKYSEYLNDSKFQEIENNYNKAIHFLDVYMKALKDNLIKELQEKIGKIENAYKTNNDINHSILDLFAILMNNYKILQNNYFISSNVINNCNFLLERMIPKHFDDKVTSLINYFQNTFISKSSGKIETFDEYNTAVMTLQKKITDHTDSISSLIILNDGRMATSSSDKTIRVINLKSFKTEMIIEGHTGPIKYLSQMKNNKLLSCSDDHTVKVWTIKSFSSYFCDATLTGHESGIYQVIPISNNRIASSSDDCTIKIWKGEMPYNCIQTLQGHNHGVIAILQLKDETFVSASTFLNFWDLKEYTLKHTINDLQCSYRNSLLEITDNRLVVGVRYGVTIINSKSFEIISKVNGSDIGWVNALIFIRPYILICGCDYGLIFQVNTSNYKIMCKKDKAHDKNIRALLKIKENSLVSGDGKGIINFWNLSIEKITC